MSSPSKSDYKPSEAEKASASVALERYKFFKENYDPKLREMRDKARDGDPSQILRARANADTMQALTNASYQNAKTLDYSSDLSKAYQGQLGVANETGRKIQNTMGSNVIGIGNKQAADATTGMSKLSRLETSEALNRAKNKQKVALAKVNAGVQVAGAMGIQGMENLSTGGTFFTPNRQLPRGQQGPPQRISSLGDRWDYFLNG